MREWFNVFNKYGRQTIKNYGGVFGKYYKNSVLKMIIIDTIDMALCKVGYNKFPMGKLFMK